MKDFFILIFHRFSSHIFNNAMFCVLVKRNSSPKNRAVQLIACDCQVKSSHLYLYSAFNNTDCVKALNSIKLEDRVSVMYNNKIKHSIFS